MKKKKIKNVPKFLVVGKEFMIRQFYQIGFKLVLRITHTNFFLTLVNKNGNVIFWTSGGRTGFEGSRRASTVAAENAGLVLKRIFGETRFNKPFIIRSKDFRKKQVFAILRGLGDCSNLRGFVTITKMGHNGLRRRKIRRV